MSKWMVFRGCVMAAMMLSICTAQEKTAGPRGPYLGQTPPGLTPEIFAPGIVSTDKTELGCSFSPDGTEVFFTEWNAGKNTLMTMKQIDGQWTKRSVASFSGTFSDVDPYFSSDGKRLYFSSKRPLQKEGEAKDSDIWYAEKKEDGNWSDPIHLGAPNTSGKDDYYTSIADNGTLYSSIFGTHGSPGNLYTSNCKNGKYTKPKLLNSINSEYNDHDPFIAPDESYLIFTSARPGGFGKEDLYISIRKKDGFWSEPENMGTAINSPGYDFCPLLSPDGKYLFFTRNVNRNGDIYWVDAKIIDSFLD